MTLENVLIVFVKYPESGLVKTRLARAIGDDKAAGLYRALAEAILARTADPRYTRIIFYTPEEKRGEVADWLGGHLELLPQEGNSLGERMHASFEFSFGRGAKRVVVIGTDAPLLDSAVVLEAFEKLRVADCVIGPSRDGGYYLLGLTRPCGELFRGVEWGTVKVLEQTLGRVRGLGLRYCLLEAHFDVDDLGSLKLLKRLVREGSASGERLPKPLVDAVESLDRRGGASGGER